MAADERRGAYERGVLLREASETLWDFDKEALLSLLRPGRIAEWKQRLFELRVRIDAEIGERDE